MASRPRPRNCRRAFTLLEVVVAAGMMAALMTAGMVLLRTSQSVWEGYQDDHDRLEAGHAVVRHVVRHVRQADAITSLKPADDGTGRLTITTPSGEEYTWGLAGTAAQLAVDGVRGPLALGISTLEFVGYEADGVTVAATETDVQCVECTVTVQLPRTSGETRTIRGRAWRRGW